VSPHSKANLGEEVVEHRKKEVLKGIEVPSVLYVWRDLQELINRLASGCAGLPIQIQTATGEPYRCL
jgi:hypothetical protein